jgi:predicted TPR repeat methyltransferase
MKCDASAETMSFEQRGIDARDAGRHAEAECHFSNSVCEAPDRPLSWLGLALSQIDLDRPEDAIVSLRRAKELSPQSSVVTHLLDSLNGTAPARAPDGYVNWLFNTYAAGFDRHLARLGYQGPEMLRRITERAGWVADGSRNILDLGCGTGLSGLPFVPYASRLEGIDLSVGMLAQAQRRGIYAELYHGEIHAVLDTLPAAGHDTVIAGDTLIYIGDLSPLLGLVCDRLKPGGNFIFTVETGEDGFSLAQTGRYQHADDYLRSCAEGRFEIADRIDGVIRIEAGRFTPARAYRLTKI